jgi:nitrite reductase/ring-hydroxylating ferredoxin subunit
MNDISQVSASSEAPVVIPVEAYISEAYARAEGEKLWAKVWQTACRVEEIPKVGDYVTYDILDESIIVVRTAKDRIQAFFNVCQHRGRRLTEGCGHTAQFYCRFHGWRWNIDGESAFVLDPEDWQGALTQDNLRLKPVQCDTWGGWVWVNMDPDAEPLAQYLEPATPKLDPFELEKMRYGFRQWMVVKCNWKTALEAFAESYHVDATHPQLGEWGVFLMWSRAEGKHACHGVRGPRGAAVRGSAGASLVRMREGQDPRKATFDNVHTLLTTGYGVTSETIVEAARRLVDELPEGTPPEVVAQHLMASAQRDDAARGVVWPKVDSAFLGAVGHDWHIFPNMVILPSLTYAVCYRARPNGGDPDSCIFEAFALERFPEGQEPKTEWVQAGDASAEVWRLILSQDFQNLVAVQRGMHSRGFQGPRPSPVQEVAITNFHRTLASYMGLGAPMPIQRLDADAAPTVREDNIR